MAQLIIGLGNPGAEYAATRHNVGWRCLDELARRGRFARERREGQARIREGTLEGFDVVLAAPKTYMNLSGRAALQLTGRFGVPVADVIVIYDEIDLPLGRLRLRRGGGAGGHNGVRSLIDSWQSADFIRVRLGVGRPPEGVDPADYVLRSFARDEREHVEAMVHSASDAVIAILREGLDTAMNLYNRRPDA
jgi:PTH1 family peptidyl-tRNA hydrolase